MNDNEIIGTLEKIAKEQSSNFLKTVLAIINRQKAEIERLKHRKTELQIRNQELQHEKSEAIKEFAERLKEIIIKAIDTYYTSNGGGYYLAEDTIEDIDNLVKEMTEVEINQKKEDEGE